MASMAEEKARVRPLNRPRHMTTQAPWDTSRPEFGSMPSLIPWAALVFVGLTTLSGSTHSPRGRRQLMTNFYILNLATRLQIVSLIRFHLREL